MIYYKVLNSQLKSGGVYGSKPVQYIINEWVKDPGKITKEPLRGGLFVLNKPSDAKVLLKKRPNAVVYRCVIGRVLRKTRYLTKTDRIKLVGKYR